jgi:N-glycosylase/DNA lyase
VKEDSLKNKYLYRKTEIQNRLNEFKQLGRTSGKKELFGEIAYCICTPQNPFENCQAALSQLLNKDILFTQDESVISFFLLKNIRFHNNKAKYIVQARAKLFDEGCEHEISGLVKKLLSMRPTDARNYLWEINIRGIGMKECSHFVRNIGQGDDVAILDSHITRLLFELGVINEIPRSITNHYIEIENKMRSWSKRLGLSLGEMDILLWSEDTGEISN